jgi:predicted CxxxxCH...CXXCH cytochrome family protein
MRAPSWRPVQFLAVCLLAAAGCTQSSTSNDPTPAGANHRVHLQSANVAEPLSCGSCHAASGFAVDFSQNPTLQAAGAHFDPVTKTCSNVACHGTFTIGLVSGSFASPRWNDSGVLGCSSCHAMPPVGHPGLGTTSAPSNCAGCHSDTVNPDGTINVATGAHMNGQADVTGGTCTTCHGDASRVPGMPGVDPFVTSAPPASPAGAPAYADGAHLIHLNPNPAVAASVPTLCNECHVVPGDATHATNPPAQRVVFGGRALANGARPTFDPVTGGCSASYCHGNFSFNGVSGATTTMLWADATRISCGSCHAMPPTGHPAVAGTSAASCSVCHPTSVDPQGVVIPGGAHMNTKADVAALGCTSCHGDGTRVGLLAGTDVNLVSAPPQATTGAPATVTGAHAGHVNPAAATALSAPISCVECHVVPGDFAHATANTPRDQRVVFGPLSRTGGAAPTYTSTSLGCAATYCHGNFSFAGVSGSRVTVTWTDATAITCTSCHGMPPAGHPPVPLPSPVTAASCAGCHPKAVNADGSINRVDGAHLNGLPDTSAVGCTTCHGDPARVAHLPGTDANLLSSPPAAPANAPAYATGVHEGHVNPTAASALMAPIACAECHVVPTDSTHAKTPPTQKVVFGAFSRTGGASATWSAASAGCSATYCHGNFTFGAVKGAVATATWTSTSPVTCTSCHGMPPTGHFAVAAPVTAASCAACHPDAVNADGTINRAGGAHLNGKSDVNTLACTTCHGDATRKANLAGTDAALTSAPPVANASAPSYAVGAHVGHLNPTAASYLMAPIACKECHVVPADQAHATNPPAQKVVFGALSRTGGAAPTFNATTSGCAATWCHGNFTLGVVKGANATPLWTATWPTGEARCVNCHGMPPTGHPTYAGSQTAGSCFQCHPQSVNSDGTIKQGGGHINGKTDGGGCTGCHGDPPTTGKHTKSDHRNLRCDKCHPTGYTSSTVVTGTHDNGTVNLGSQAGYMCAGTTSLVGCKTGQTRTCTNSCHGRETW